MKGILIGLAVLAAAGMAQAASVPSYPAEEALAMGYGMPEGGLATCTGRIGVLRFSRPAEGGTFKGFREAVAAHQAWLHAQGHKDVRFEVHRTVFPRGRLGFGSLMIYPDHARYEAITAGRQEIRDEAYDSFVAAYRTHSQSYVTLTYVWSLSP